MTLDVCVLGSVAASVGGEPAALTSANQRRLLGVLTVRHGSTVSREVLAETLGVSLGGVRTAVSRLRGAVGADHIVCNPPGYALVCGRVDSAAADELAREAAVSSREAAMVLLEEARGLWDGEALAEFGAEEWAVAEAVRLRGLRAHIEEEWIDSLIICNQLARAVSALEAHIPRHPFRERPRHSLMVALACSGRSVEAIRAFQLYRAFLGSETGCEPSSDLLELERLIINGDSQRALQTLTGATDPEAARFQAGCAPDGRQTFLFADATSDVDLWGQKSDVIAQSLNVYDSIVGRSIELHGGEIFVDSGGSFGAAFEHTNDAVSAAIDCRAELRAADWSSGPAFGIRAGVHAGQAVHLPHSYVGVAVDTAACVCRVANDNQILVTGDVAHETHYMVRALGCHQLDGVEQPVDVWQVGSEETRPIAEKPEALASLRELAWPREFAPVPNDSARGNGSPSPADALV